MVSEQGIARADVGRKKAAPRKRSAKPSAAVKEEKAITKRLVKDVFSELESALKRADLWDSLDYFQMSLAMQKRENSIFPSFEWISCAPVTSGGNHYVYIGTILKGRHNLIFVGKTSEGFDKACEVANKCACELGA